MKMPLSVDVHNYMEILVAQLLALEYAERYSHEQLADLACLALSQLRPVYIRNDIDFLSALPEGRMLQLRKHVKDAVEAAETLIKNDRRRNRNHVNDIPVVVSSSRYDEALELEWYEQPIRRRIHMKEH
jgi:hypothetical protein